MKPVKNVVILGATGSIGSSALQVISRHADRFRLLGISANRKVRELADIAERFKVSHAAISDPSAIQDDPRPVEFPAETVLESGEDAVCRLAALPDADLVLVALVGVSGLNPVLAAIEAGNTVVLANKEVLVMAGEWVMRLARQKGVQILPADSEHNALFQCLYGDLGNLRKADKLILTASGGPFREKSLREMREVTAEQALRHPNWDMGPKVSLDSATMANKGLELIEARWLFDASPAILDVVVHPQSIVHSMVRYRDGSIIAQMSPPSMTFPLQYCFFHPERLPGVDSSLDFSSAFSLDFEPPDLQRFPCLRLAFESLHSGGSAPCVFNAANEVAGAAFLQGKIPFTGIARVIDKTLECASISNFSNFDSVIEADREARGLAIRQLNSIS